MNPCPLLIVPGLRDHVEQHWQTLLAQRLPHAVTVPPMGRDNLSCQQRVDAIEAAVAAGPQGVVIVAHSGGCISVAHWAAMTRLAGKVKGALLATPPDFDSPMPAGYPDLAALAAGGWLPVPRAQLPFRSLVALSSNDPLATPDSVHRLAQDWGSEVVALGAVGHLNPASGFGPWPGVDALVQRLANAGLAAQAAHPSRKMA